MKTARAAIHWVPVWARPSVLPAVQQWGPRQEMEPTPGPSRSSNGGALYRGAGGQGEGGRRGVVWHTGQPWW